MIFFMAIGIICYRNKNIEQQVKFRPIFTKNQPATGGFWRNRSKINQYIRVMEHFRLRISCHLCRRKMEHAMMVQKQLLRNTVSTLPSGTGAGAAPKAAGRPEVPSCRMPHEKPPGFDTLKRVTERASCATTHAQNNATTAVMANFITHINIYNNQSSFCPAFISLPDTSPQGRENIQYQKKDMKKKKFNLKKAPALVLGVALLCGAKPALAQPAPDTLRLTLHNALEIALSENLTVKVAEQEIQKQRLSEKGAYGSLFPQIDFQVGYQRSIKKQRMYLDGIPGMDAGVEMGRDNLWSGGFTAAMPLVSVPLWKSLIISKQEVELSIEKALSSQTDMVDQVRRAFYAVLLAEDAHVVFKEAYDNALQNYQEIKNKFDQGTLARYDLIRANVNVKNAEPNLYDAENAIILACWHLKALLGVDMELEIQCAGSLADYREELLTERPDRNYSLDNNSDLRQIAIQQKQLKYARQMQWAQYYPSLALQLSYQWLSTSNNLRMGHYRWDPYSTLGLSLNIPLFSGGKRWADTKKANVSIKQLDMQRSDVERKLRVALRQFDDQMSTCVKQYLAAEAGVAEAENGYNITMKRYETGEGTLLEINDSQLQLTQARLNLNQSIYNYLVAKSSLEKTLGQYTEE
jgi:outer membrane protein TolC